MKNISLYFHIPFCIKKCNYCSFYSLKFNENLKEKFINSLIKEIELNLDLIKNYKIKTIYFGGGTPSLLSEKDYEVIFNFLSRNLNLSNLKEITLEANPESVEYEKFKNLYNFGINRISLGVQSFIESSLKFLGRVHSKQKILESYEILRKIGFKNINIDLILGIPNENLFDLENNLKMAILLNPEHISIYSLEYHEDTKIYFDLIKRKFIPWNKEMERKGFILIKDVLTKENYIHYEISNYARKNFESLHNLNYWSGGEYLGFGPSSYSFINKVYIQNGNLFFYFKSIEYNKKPYFRIQYLSEEKLKRVIFILSLRKINGVNLKEFEKLFGRIDSIYEKLRDFKKGKFLEFSKENVKLTIDGILISNEIFSNLI